MANWRASRYCRLQGVYISETSRQFLVSKFQQSKQSDCASRVSGFATKMRAAKQSTGNTQMFHPPKFQDINGGWTQRIFFACPRHPAKVRTQPPCSTRGRPKIFVRFTEFATSSRLDALRDPNTNRV